MSELDYKLALDEVKADGEDSETSEPVSPAGGDPKKKNRKMDVSKSVDPKADDVEDDVKTPEGKGGTSQMPSRKGDNKKGMKESVEEMFSGQDLSEEFKAKATVVFEAAVNTKVNEEVDRLSEEFDIRMEAHTENVVTDLVEKVDSYLDYVVEKWMDENELAVDNGIKNRITESFLEGIYDLFVEHNISIPDESVDAVSAISEELENTEKNLNEAVEEIISLRKNLTESQKGTVIEEVAEGLTNTQVERLEKLVEGIEYDNIEDLKEKSIIIRENYFGKMLTEDSDITDAIEEDEEGNVRHIDPSIDRYVKAISKSIAK
jgi:hypothetical protein